MIEGKEAIYIETNTFFKSFLIDLRFRSLQEREPMITYIPKLVDKETNKSLLNPISKEELCNIVLYRGKKGKPQSYMVVPLIFSSKCGTSLLDIYGQHWWLSLEDEKKCWMSFNISFVTLIPSKESTLSFDSFKPISPYNLV